MAFLTGNGQTLQSRALELGAAWLVVANEARFKVWFGLVWFGIVWIVYSVA